MTCSKDRVKPGSREKSGKANQSFANGSSRADLSGSLAAGARPLEDWTDSQLVDLAVKDSQEAFEELFNRYRERVYRIAYGWCFDAQTSLDLVQDVFSKAFRSIESFRRESSIWTWLCRITINRCLDYVRKKERSKEISVEAPEDIVSHNGRQDNNPAREAELGELKAALAGAIDDLSPEARSAFTLRFFDDLSYKEIADALKCSVGTVMSRLFYARQRLKDLLKDYL